MTELEVYIESYFGISKEKLSLLAEMFEETTLEKGDFFTEIGKPCNKLSFIKDGYLRVYAQTENKEVTQWISSKGEFVTDLSSLVFNTSSRWNIEALTDCQFYTINKVDYNKIAEVIPEWVHLEKLFISKCFLTLEDRVFSFLSMSAEERYNMLMEHKKELFNYVPHLYLASMLGMTPETLSRVRKKSIS